jgi:pantetheine-phosphate adenylyltransferase
MLKGVYAGSFDPPTNGHLWMIDRGAMMFDQLTVAIGENSEKKCMFTIAERKAMLSEISKKHKNISITSFENELLINYARSINAQYILRGIRSYKDYEYEKAIREVNEDLDKDILTIFLIPSNVVSNISSSLVKGLIGSKGWERAVKRYVPECVFEELMKKSRKLGKDK